MDLLLPDGETLHTPDIQLKQAEPHQRIEIIDRPHRDIARLKDS